jgi:hypothetical protein
MMSGRLSVGRCRAAATPAAAAAPRRSLAAAPRRSPPRRPAPTAAASKGDGGPFAAAAAAAAVLVLGAAAAPGSALADAGFELPYARPEVTTQSSARAVQLAERLRDAGAHLYAAFWWAARPGGPSAGGWG